MGRIQLLANRVEVEVQVYTTKNAFTADIVSIVTLCIIYYNYWTIPLRLLDLTLNLVAQSKYSTIHVTQRRLEAVT